MTTPKRAHRLGTWRGLDNYECPLCAYASLEARAFDAHSCRGEVRLAPAVLDEVEFASTRAMELAGEHGLLPRDFAGIAASSASGFTTSDVRALVADSEE